LTVVEDNGDYDVECAVGWRISVWVWCGTGNIVVETRGDCAETLDTDRVVEIGY